MNDVIRFCLSYFMYRQDTKRKERDKERTRYRTTQKAHFAILTDSTICLILVYIYN